MSWNNLGSYLAKFKNIKTPKDFTQKGVFDFFEETFPGVFKKEDFSFSSGVLRVRSKNPAIRNQLFIRKAEILSLIKKKKPNLSVVDIRFN